MTETKHLWDADHSYAGADSNYFANFHQQEGYFREFASWKEFTESDSFDTDMDYNLMYRFDWSKGGEDAYPEQENVQFFYIQQRRGAVAADTIFVTAEDEPAVRAYLQKYADHMRDLWAPFDMGSANV